MSPDDPYDAPVTTTSPDTGLGDDESAIPSGAGTTLSPAGATAASSVTLGEDDAPPRPASMRDRLVTPMPSDRLWGWLGPIIVTVIAGVLRFWDLGRPKKVVFDETYYAKDAFSLLKYGYERSVVTPPKGDPAIDVQILSGRTNIFSTDPSYVVHPPVGKWMIAFGEWIFGLTPFGWRFSVALFGTLTVLMLARIARRLFRSTLLGCVAGLLLALDGLSIVMSRTALLDGLLTFWILAAFGCLLIDRDRMRERLADRMDAARAAGHVPAGGPRIGFRWWRLAAGVCFGLAMATKWSALYVIAACGLMSLVWDMAARRRAGIKRPYSGGVVYDGVTGFGALVVTAVVTYTVSWTGWFVAPDSCFKTWATTGTDACSRLYGGGSTGPATGLGTWVPDAVRSWWHYHAQMYHFHTTLTATHPYAAKAYRWLYLGRPTQFDFSQYDANSVPVPPGVGTKTPEQLCGADRCAADIVGVGTPAIWWAALLALIVCLVLFFARWDWRAGSILTVFAATYFPWFMYGERPIFFFYAVVIIPFMILALTYAIGLLLGPAVRGSPRRVFAAVAVGAYLIVVVWNLAYLYPVLTSEWIPYTGYGARMWFNSWI